MYDLRIEFFSWLRMYCWDGFFTGTFRYECKNSGRALKTFHNWWISTVGRGYYFCCAETVDDFVHLHAVLGGCRNFDFKAAENSWGDQYGRCEFPKFDPERGGLKYLTKNANDPFWQYEIAGQWPEKNEGVAMGNQEPNMVNLKLSEVIIDEEKLQPRVKLHDKVIEDYKKLLDSGYTFPPVVVFQTDEGKQYLADGFHRYRAEKELCRSEIFVDLRYGTLEDALEFTIHVNGHHGLRYSNKDKNRAVRLLVSTERWRDRSLRDVADLCGVSPEMVRKVKKKLEMENVGDKAGNSEIEDTSAETEKKNENPLDAESGAASDPENNNLDAKVSTVDTLIYISKESEVRSIDVAELQDISPGILLAAEDSEHLRFDRFKKVYDLDVPCAVFVVGDLTGETNSGQGENRELQETKDSQDNVKESEIMGGEL